MQEAENKTEEAAMGLDGSALQWTVTDGPLFINPVRHCALDAVLKRAHLQGIRPPRGSVTATERAGGWCGLHAV